MATSEHLENIPSNVVEAMRAMLKECLVKARGREAPGDGSMNLLGDRRVNKKWWLQASFLCDTRFEPKEPHVVVHAFHEDMASKGFLREVVVYTRQDRLALANERLSKLLEMKRELDEEIHKCHTFLAQNGD